MLHVNNIKLQLWIGKGSRELTLRMRISHQFDLLKHFMSLDYCMWSYHMHIHQPTENDGLC